MTQKRSAFTLVKFLSAVAIVGLLVGLLIPPVVPQYGRPRHRVCHNNLKLIALALQNYHDDHGHFPPAYTVDESGNRLHSWRTLILPYIEWQELYETIDLSKPWDDPANAKAMGKIVDDFRCPSNDLPPGMTTYLAAVGPKWAFAGDTPRKLDDIKDGAAQTLAVLEVNPERAVHWMSPHDFVDDGTSPFGDPPEGVHSEGNNAAYVDGHVELIPADITPEKLNALLTIAGGEKIEE